MNEQSPHSAIANSTGLDPSCASPQRYSAISVGKSSMPSSGLRARVEKKERREKLREAEGAARSQGEKSRDVRFGRGRTVSFEFLSDQN